RRLGQHFLFTDSILERIAVAACPRTEPMVIEIGPGPGGLTRHLTGRAQRLAAIELDAVLAEGIRQKFGKSGVEVVAGDVLETDLTQWGEAVVCGNLPYFITSPILEKTLAMGRKLRRAVFLVQKEVAERITAQPGNRDYGYLSISVQARAKAEMLFIVKAAAFKPPPKVDSAVIRLTPIEEAGSVDLAGFLRFAGLCFHMKRKTLRNNLTAAYPAALISELPEAGLRAEQLSVVRLMDLYRRVREAVEAAS
ncbi:MAG TPA: 16S rRNA (adenine(1518)-N(6)/adenine(1519)-N(6))-dimethyltransferase RsmA, partial [Bryobacteraceae bacterium]|nr:16S rRNA (adenine(1518)-N(6)/adenine(1519)-N(6))-dimethyltransferase RsmA [Bryobacteraceae bacterium]